MTWLFRSIGLTLGVLIGWWAQVLLRASGGFGFLHTLGAESRETVTSATRGIVVPDAPPKLSDVFGQLGTAFGVLGILVALVLIVASVFPYEWWRRRKAVA